MEGHNPQLPTSLDWKMSKWKTSIDKVQMIGAYLNDLTASGPSSIGSSREYFQDSRTSEWASSKITSPASSISSQKFLESGKRSGTLRSYHKGNAVRALKLSLADLVKFILSIDDSFQKREPNSPLTSRERRKLSLISEDYQTALTTVLEDQRHEENVPVDVDSVEFHVQKDVADGVSPYLYEAIFSGSGNVESVIAALDLCETQVREFKKLLPVVRVCRHQCTNLVETLEPTATKNFGRCHKVMDGLQKLEADGGGFFSGNRSKSHVHFESLVGLARKFQLVVDLLRKCASENLPKMALEVADLLSPPLLSRRWSKFSLAIRNWEWGMDLVEFAFYMLENLLAGGTYILDVPFKWCEEKCRMVLQIEGELGREDSRLEKSVLDVSNELEAQDMGDLIDQPPTPSRGNRTSRICRI